MPEQTMWLQDFEVGQTFEAPPYTVSLEEIQEFASEFDAQPFHLDPEAAKGSVFGQLVASGWHMTALNMKLFLANGPKIEGGAVGLNVDELRWGAVRPGDALTWRMEVDEIRPSASGKPRGIVRMRHRLINQDGEDALHFIVSGLVPARE